jgi:hypothetical protein
VVGNTIRIETHRCLDLINLVVSYDTSCPNVPQPVISEFFKTKKVKNVQNKWRRRFDAGGGGYASHLTMTNFKIFVDLFVA